MIKCACKENCCTLCEIDIVCPPMHLVVSRWKYRVYMHVHDIEWKGRKLTNSRSSVAWSAKCLVFLFLAYLRDHVELISFQRCRLIPIKVYAVRTIRSASRDIIATLVNYAGEKLFNVLWRLYTSAAHTIIAPIVMRRHIYYMWIYAPVADTCALCTESDIRLERAFLSSSTNNLKFHHREVFPSHSATSFSLA